MERHLKIAIVGTAASSRELAPYQDDSWRKWLVGEHNRTMPCADVWFELHTPQELATKEQECWIKWLSEQEFRIYLQEKHPAIPMAERFPIEAVESLKPALAHNIGQITFRPMRGLTRRQRDCEERGQNYRIVTALRRRDEQGKIYDLTRVFFEELLRHPFALHDDLIDAASRIYDIDPQAPDFHEAQSTESLDVDYTDLMEGDGLA